MPWQEAHALGVAEMDATHQAFVAQVDALLLAPDPDFPELLQAVLQHCRLHFEQEGRLMRHCRFPAIGEHESEHLRVLGELAYFGRAARSGRIRLAREYVRHLPEWFAAHLATMDSALAACLRRSG
ncbi:MAG: hypothetical protein RIR00_10 [Pseudomonadota bacterium]|jgi:hemerythrin-like metal-binding protein